MPTEPKIYHIVHVDRLSSIIADGQLWCDAEMVQRSGTGTSIGMNSIKRRRLEELTLRSYPGLHVGACVPFYFCPRSVMLYVIHRGNNPELEYDGGQGSIVHLEATLRQAVTWAGSQNLRWAFTSSNAGARYFEDYSDLGQLAKINWDAVQAQWWSGPDVDETVRHRKQAEFLVERSFAWSLITHIGVHSREIRDKARGIVQASDHRPPVEIKPDWYY